MKRKMTLILSAIVLIMSAFILAACSSRSEANGSLRVYLTDAPADEFDSVIVNIKQIAVIDTVTEEMITVLEFEEDSVRLNLIDLAGVNELLGTALIPDGIYSQVRVVVYENGNYAVAKDQTEKKDLKIPSGTQSGIKVVVPGGFTVLDGAITSIVLDWDLQSEDGTKIHEAGGRYIMRPVIKLKNIEVEQD